GESDLVDADRADAGGAGLVVGEGETAAAADPELATEGAEVHLGRAGEVREDLAGEVLVADRVGVEARLAGRVHLLEEAVVAPLTAGDVDAEEADRLAVLAGDGVAAGRQVVEAVH